MHRSSILVITLTAAFVGVAVSAALPGESGDSPTTARERHRAAEIVRLRAHFDSVDAELRARDLSALTPAQRTARARLVAWLRDYRGAGRFPENDRFPTAQPFFRDHHGVLCAMAYLIDRSGRGDIVDDVARHRNNAYIRELVDDPRLVAWLDSSGLTVAEAARIQPTYGYPPDEPVGGGRIEPEVSRSYAITAASTMGASLATAAINLIAPSRAMGVAGTLVGAGTVGVGVVGLNRRGEYRGLGTVTTAVGTAALATGIHAIMRTARRGARSSEPRFTFAPSLFARREGRSPGVVMRARF